MFSVFKQYDTYFHPHIFLKKTENYCLNTRTKYQTGLYTPQWASAVLLL